MIKTSKSTPTLKKRSRTVVKKVQTDLEKVSQFNQALLDTIPFGMDIVDAKGRILFVNDKLKKMIGKRALGKQCWILYRDDRHQCSNCPLKHPIKKGQTETIESESCFGGKTLLISHTGMTYDGKDAVLEVFQDITQLKQVENELRTANVKLERLNELKSEFVATVSHESKNPLGIIRESIALILEGVLGDLNAEQRDALVMGKKATDRLLRLVTDLLDLSKIEAGKIEIKREKIMLAPWVDEVVGTYQSVLMKKRQTLKTEVSDEVGFLWADHDRLTEVMTNLLTNAVKYTPEEGVICVRVLGNDADVRFEVVDTGPGILPEDQKRIFDKYVRVTAEKQEGAGLGLAIAKEIVELHHGKMWVESEAGKGSCFIFVLPRNLRAE